MLFAHKILLKLCDCHFGKLYFEINCGELIRPWDKAQRTLRHKLQTGVGTAILGYLAELYGKRVVLFDSAIRF